MSPAVTHQTVYAARLNFITTPSRQETRNGTSPYVTRLPVTRTNAQLNFQLSKALPVTHQGMRRPLLVERENTCVDKYNRFVFFIIPFTIVTIATIVNPHVYEMKYLLFKNISGWRVVWNQCTFFIYKNKSILHSRQTHFIEIHLLFLYLQSFVSSFSLYYFQVFALESKSVRHGAINHTMNHEFSCDPRCFPCTLNWRSRLDFLRSIKQNKPGWGSGLMQDYDLCKQQCNLHFYTWHS